VRLPRPEPETQFLLLAAAVGALGALVNFAFRGLLELAHESTVGRAQDLFEPMGPGWRIVVVALAPVLGGLAVGWLGRATRTEVGGYGMPSFIETVNLRTAELSVKRTLVRALAALATLASGGSAGVEGPIASVGGGLAGWIARARAVYGERLRVLVASGASAAVAAAYGAPIAGVFFTQEIVLAGNYELQNFVRVVVAAASATVVARGIRGDEPLYASPAFAIGPPADILGYLALGLACGVVGALFARAFFRAQRIFRGARVPAHYKPAIGGALVGVLALGAPGVLGTGHAVLGDLVGRTSAVALEALPWLALLLVAKVVATSVTIGSGGAGGVFGPSLCLGAVLGTLVAGCAHAISGDVGAVSAHYAIVGMGAVLAATARAPLTSIFLVFEMTGSSSTAVLPTLIAVAASIYVARRIESHSIDETALAQRGIHLKEGRELAVLQSVTAGQAMRADFVSVRASAQAPELQALVHDSRSNAFVVVDGDERMVGILALQDLRVLDQRTAEDLGALTIAADLCERDVVTVFADESLAVALARMDRHGYRQLPVVDRADPRRVLGMLERRHVLTAYRKSLLEQSQTRFYARPGGEGSGEAPE
jgi:CIC family chloride channel protein